MRYLLFIIMALFLFACGSSDSGSKSDQQSPQTNSNGELTDFQIQNGIGPVTQKVFLGKVNKSLAARGEKSFDTKCASCHKMDQRYIGPALRYVTVRRTNEYVLNMILNPDEMVKRHPVARQMLAEYISPMTFQNVQMQEAKDLLEFLRLKAEEGREQNIPEVPIFANQQ